MSVKIEIKGVRKLFGSAAALNGVNLAVNAGEFLGILGKSGAGKTTLLNLIAGLEKPSDGEIWIGDRLASDRAIRISPRERCVGMLFQSLALWPHMDVCRHLQFVLRSRRIPAEEQMTRIMEILSLLHLERYLTSLPHMLSGGERQRLALARALAGDPRILLLDEPLSNLDTPLRDELLSYIRKAHEKTGTTTLFVSHNPGETFRIADRIAVIDGGRVLQTGAPEEVYADPVSMDSARLTGKAGWLPGTIAEEGWVETALGRFRYRGGKITGPNATLLVRPSEVELSTEGTAKAVVADSSLQEGRWLNTLTWEGGKGVLYAWSDERNERGRTVGLRMRSPPWLLPPRGGGEGEGSTLDK